MADDMIRICRLPETGCLRVSGQDATGFLQAQLSQDLSAGTAQSAQLAGWHDARGRVRALFHVIRYGDAWLLVTQRGIIEQIARELRRFVLRSDVEITELDGWSAFAIIAGSEEFLAQRGVDLGDAAGAVCWVGNVVWQRLGPELVHCIGPASSLGDLADARNSEDGHAIAAEIELGLPAISPQTMAEYVPQMLNLERLGAIAFDKGCYPGQEVIARTQHLGSVKRRARVFSRPAVSVAPGTGVVNASGERIGDVIRAARRDADTLLLAVVRLDALDEALFLESDASTPLSPVRMPSRLID